MRFLSIVLDWSRAGAGLVLGMYMAGWYAPGSSGAPWVSAGALIFGEYLSAGFLRIAESRKRAHAALDTGAGAPAQPEVGKLTKYLLIVLGPLLLALVAGIIVAFNLQNPPGKLPEMPIVVVYAGAGLVFGGALGLCDAFGLAPALYPRKKKKKRKKA